MLFFFFFLAFDSDEWESTRGGFIGLYTVTQHLHDYLAHKIHHTHLEVMYLCGADLVTRCQMTSVGDFAVVCVGRPGMLIISFCHTNNDNDDKDDIDSNNNDDNNNIQASARVSRDYCCFRPATAKYISWNKSWLM